MKNPRRPKLDWAKAFDSIMAAGAERHGASWLFANRAATEKIAAITDYTQPDMRVIVSAVVLAVLDRIHRKPSGPPPDYEI